MDRKDPWVVKNLGLAGTVELAENALPRTGGIVDGSLAVKQWLSTFDRVYVASNNGFAGVELSDSRTSNTATLEMNGTGGVYISQKTNGQVNVNHIPKTNGILLNSADIIQSVGDSVSQVMSQKSVTDALDNRLEKSRNGADIPNKPEFVRNIGLVGTVKLAENALPRTGGVVDGSIAVKQWLSTYDRVYVAANNGFAGVELSDTRNKNTVTIEMNGAGGAIISQKTNGQVNVNHIPKTNGTLLNSADAEKYVTSLRLSTPREITTKIDEWLDFSTNEFVVGVRLSRTPGGGVWVIERLRVANLQIMRNGGWINVTQ
ncbi:hypothetical protein [Xenorhabdus ehlersii]|uniref:hypothetical protein n=1 Tax=Xenorhabdus ehlersii TaxID=290111 RepID=UPI000E75D8A6|nr:hypothetical protein [Xenorhabdus ehlersii]